MIQTMQILPQILTSNTDNINFTTTDVRTRSATCCGWLQYMNGGSDFTLIGGGRFKISFNANVTSETAGSLALALKSSLGSDVEGTEVCPRVNTTIAIGSIPAIGGVTPIVETEIPTIKDGNLIIEKLNG